MLRHSYGGLAHARRNVAALKNAAALNTGSGRGKQAAMCALEITIQPESWRRPSRDMYCLCTPGLVRIPRRQSPTARAEQQA
jgi:hypothetical protein